MRWPTSSGAREALLALATLALEVAPVQAWLIVYAAAEVGDMRQTAAPLWLLILIVSAFALARRWLTRYGTGALLGAWLLLGVGSMLALARFSPLLYGIPDYPLDSISWLNALYAGQFSDSALVAMSALIVYLGWRGTVVGKRVTGFLQVSRRFWIGFGAVALAIFGSLAAPAIYQDQIGAALLGLLALEGVAGLTALSLARPLGGASREDAFVPGVEQSFRWHALSVLMALGIVAGVILVSLSVNVGAAHAVLVYLGPVGTVLNAVAEYVTLAIAFVLFLISSALLSLFFKPHSGTPPVNPSHVNQGLGKRLPPAHVPPVFTTIAGALVAVAVVALVIVIAYLIARAIASARDKVAAEALDEEREGLELQGVLSEQARALRDWWRGRRRQAEADTLRRTGARWHYRAVMRAGARAGVERAPSETAREYAGRLSRALEPANGAHSQDSLDLDTLARDYEDARYGGEADEDPEAPATMDARSRAITARIATLAKDAGPKA